MSGDLESRTWGRFVQATDAEKAAVTRCVKRIALDDEDRDHLLDILGLAPRQVTEHGMRGYRQGCKCRKCTRANAARNRRQKATKEAS